MLAGLKKEGCLLPARSCEWLSRRPEHISCVSRRSDEFFQRIWVEMNRRSADLTKLRLVFIGDGAEWIWNRVAEIDNADNGVYILDFCHAVDHLAKVCKLLYGQGARRSSTVVGCRISGA